VSCLYSPNKDLENLALVEYEAIKCRSCMAVLNPYCQIDFSNKLWVCNFCQSRVGFPSHYADFITEQNLPAELLPAYTTIEYIDSKNPVQPNIFLFLVDLCLS
jgi:protein transport protein SEC23